jgi:hydrogenase-4 component E
VIAAANLLAFLGLVTALLVVWRQSWRGRVRLFVAQSAVLALLAAVVGVFAGKPALLAVGGVVVALKVVLIPRALRRMAVGEPVRPVAPGRSVGLPLLAAGLLIVAAFVVMLPVAAATDLPTEGGIPLAFAMTLIGLLVCVTGRDVLGHVLGFLMLENGIFALALLATYGLPGIVEAGVFLDVLVIVLLMEGVALDIRREHDTLEVDRLRELRG